MTSASILPINTTARPFRLRRSKTRLSREYDNSLARPISLVISLAGPISLAISLASVHTCASFRLSLSSPSEIPIG